MRFLLVLLVLMHLALSFRRLLAEFAALVVDYGSGMSFPGFAGLTHLALCPHDCRQFVRCSGCSFAVLGNLYIISTSLLRFPA